MCIINVIVLCGVIPLIVAKDSWVDPHALGSDPKVNIYEKKSNLETNSPADIHLKRIIRLILAYAYLDNDGSDEINGHLKMRMSSNDYNILTKFSINENSISPEEIAEISAILEGSFQKTTLEQYMEKTASLWEFFAPFVFNEITICLIGVLSLLIMLNREQYSLLSLFKYIIMPISMLCVLFTYWEMRQEMEIEHFVKMKVTGDAPPECDPGKMSWTEYAKSQFKSMYTKTPCENYYQTAYQNRAFINPTAILSRMFRGTFVTLMDITGEGIGKFTGNLFWSMPFGFNIILFPIIIIIVTFLIVIGLLLITKTPITLGSLFLNFKIGEEQRGIKDKPNRRKALKMERRFIEDVKEKRQKRRTKPREPDSPKSASEGELEISK